MSSNSAPRNKTLRCTPEELSELSELILPIDGAVTFGDICGQLICGDFHDIAGYFPEQFIDLLILDPPYNLTKNFNGNLFRKLDDQHYVTWFREVTELLVR